MEFYEILSEIMEEKNMSIADVAKKCNLTDSTVRSIIDRKQKKIALNIAFKLSDGLQISLERLNGIPEKKHTNLSPKTIEIAKKYESLDKYGKEAVNAVLNVEYDRCLSSVDQAHEERAAYNVIYLPYPDNRASAGTGDEFLSDVTRSISVKENRLTIRADLVIKVDGNSMEPVYSDGDMVLVHQQPAVDIGAIGLYAANGKGYIKKQGKDRLISINPDYPDIMPEKNYAYKCFGQVIGKLNPEWII